MEKKNPLEESEETVTQAPETEESVDGKESSPKEEKRKSAELKQQLSEKEAELAEAKEKYLRMAAEYENYRKRSQKERDGIYTDAVSDVIGAILPIADNLERAAQYKDEPEKVAEGLAIVSKSLADMLSKFGIEQFGEPGETFDPNLHNAIMHVEDEAYGEGEILDVFQRGYRKGDKIVRYAMVRVAN
jgi:molecular chaperone GrpE